MMGINQFAKIRETSKNRCLDESLETLLTTSNLKDNEITPALVDC